jgi:hypothetical protein
MRERNSIQPDLNDGHADKPPKPIYIGELPKPMIILKTADVSSEIVYAQTELKKGEHSVVFEYGFNKGRLVCRITVGQVGGQRIMWLVGVETAESQLADDPTISRLFHNNANQLAWMIKRHAPKEGKDIIDV